jgi:hypothetical protein
MALADHDATHLQSKHIALQYHFVREHVVRQGIELKCILGVVNLADSLKKPLGKGRLMELLSRMACGPRV